MSILGQSLLRLVTTTTATGPSITARVTTTLPVASS